MRGALWGIFQLVTLPVRLIWRPIATIALTLARPLLRRIDSSARLSHTISELSSSMATQRGLLLLIGMVIVGLSLLVNVLVIAALVSAGRFDRSLSWLCLPAVLLHIGVILGFTGIMLAVPLGQGYKDR
ncbi:MAG: hypothetical protein ACUVSU_11375 [Aggregatilineaceae bacterium]